MDSCPESKEVPFTIPVTLLGDQLNESWGTNARSPLGDSGAQCITSLKALHILQPLTIRPCDELISTRGLVRGSRAKFTEDVKE